MKLYVATRNTIIVTDREVMPYSHIVGVFDSREQAEKAVNVFNDEVLKDETERDKEFLRDGYADLIEITELDSNRVYTDIELSCEVF